MLINHQTTTTTIDTVMEIPVQPLLSRIIDYTMLGDTNEQLILCTYIILKWDRPWCILSSLYTRFTTNSDYPGRRAELQPQDGGCTFGEVSDGATLVGFTVDDVCLPADDAA